MHKTIPILTLALAAAPPALAASPSPPRPPAGVAFGQVTSAKGPRFVVQSPSGVVGVILKGSTAIVEDVAARQSDLVRGACVVVNGRRDKQGRIAADGVTIAAAEANGCANPVRGGQGRPPRQRIQATQGPRGQGPRPPANVAFVAGTVASVKGTALTVRARNGSTEVVLSGKTRVTKTTRVGASAVKTGRCALVRGTADKSGLVITAQNVTVSAPGKDGCTFGSGVGFRRG